MYKKIELIYKENEGLINNIMGSLVIKVGSVLVAFCTTPVYMRYFKDQAVLGVWFTLVSLFNMLLQFNLGIGDSLRNRLAECLTENDQNKAKKFISSAYLFTTFFIVIIEGIILFSLKFISLNELLNVSENSISPELLNWGVTICLVGLCGQCVFRLIFSVYYALQKAAIPSLLSLVSNSLLLLVACIAPRGTTGQNFIVLSLAHAALTNLPLLFATIWVFLHELQKEKPSLKYVDLESTKNLLQLGLTFFFLQIASLFLTNCNEFLITTLVGPEKAVEYQVYYKIFSVPSTLFFLIMAPLWSAVTKARVEKRYLWLLNLHKLILGFIFLATLGACFLVPLVPLAVNIWLGEQAEQVEIMTKYSISFAIWCGANMLFHGNCSFANGLEWMKTQKIVVPIGGFINILGAFIAVKITKSWISIVQVNLISLLFIGISQMTAIRSGLSSLMRNNRALNDLK